MFRLRLLFRWFRFLWSLFLSRCLFSGTLFFLFRSCNFFNFFTRSLWFGLFPFTNLANRFFCNFLFFLCFRNHFLKILKWHRSIMLRLFMDHLNVLLLFSLNLFLLWWSFSFWGFFNLFFNDVFFHWRQWLRILFFFQFF